jgi:hypothetical protein
MRSLDIRETALAYVADIMLEKLFRRLEDLEQYGDGETGRRGDGATGR